jgi:glycosyltransferase involved in cell wall biosynthesis
VRELVVTRQSAPTDRAWLPGLVLDVDLADGVPAVANPGADGVVRGEAWVLVRVLTEPIGVLVVPLSADGLPAADLEGRIRSRFGTALDERVPAGESAFLAGRRAVLADAPRITVVICTRDREDSLRRTIDSVLAQDYPNFDLLVVDNAPRTDATRRTVAALPAGAVVRYVLEPKPGLSWARNAGLAALPGETEIVAWTDDDVVVDRFWLAEIARAFHDAPDAVAVSGVVVPGEIETIAQQWYEDFGGHSKGRGFRPDVFRPGDPAFTQSPLFPLPSFGVGANMAFRAGAVEALGGFDTALGAGTPTKGCEDTLAFTQLLLAGRATAYQPSALVWHYHRRGYDELAEQMYGYGVGLTAFYTSLLRDRPSRILPLLALVPAAVKAVFTDAGDAGAVRQDSFPAELIKIKKRGLRSGPAAYFRARRQARRLTG